MSRLPRGTKYLYVTYSHDRHNDNRCSFVQQFHSDGAWQVRTMLCWTTVVRYLGEPCFNRHLGCCLMVCDKPFDGGREFRFQHRPGLDRIRWGTDRCTTVATGQLHEEFETWLRRWWEFPPSELVPLWLGWHHP